MRHARRLATVLLIAITAPAFAQNSETDSSKTVQFRAPAPGTTLTFDDGTKLHFGRTTGFRTEVASEHKRYKPSKIELTHLFFVTRKEAGSNKQRYELKIDGKTLWPLALGSKRPFKSALYHGDKLSSNHDATLSVADKYGSWKLDGRTWRTVRVTIAGNWTSTKGRTGKYTIHFDYAPELGFWVRNVTSFTRPNGKEAGGVRKLTKIETKKS